MKVDIWSYAGFGAGLLVLTGLTLALGRWARIGLGLFPLWAFLRAVAQLGAIALLLGGILSVPWTAAAFIVLMLSTASVTAGGRRRGFHRGRRTAILGVLIGATLTLAAIFALQLVDFGGASPLEAAQFQLVVLAGIALTMTITGIVVTRLAGRTPYVDAGG